MNGSQGKQKLESVPSVDLHTGIGRKCSVEGCNREHRAKGYCQKHYSQVRYYGYIRNIIIRDKRTCSIKECEREAIAKGLCNKHYLQIKERGRILERTKFHSNEFWFDGNICYIQIYNREQNPKCIALIDKEDYKKVKDYKWSECSSNKMIHNHTIGLLSRFITNTTNPNIEVDHKNHDTLDNRKENLRPCTRSQNRANQLIRIDNTSGAKGVSWKKDVKKWEAYIDFNGKRKRLGYFTNKKEAIMAYNKAAITYYGEFALLNSLS